MGSPQWWGGRGGGGRGLRRRATVTHARGKGVSPADVLKITLAAGAGSGRVVQVGEYSGRTVRAEETDNIRTNCPNLAVRARRAASARCRVNPFENYGGRAANGEPTRGTRGKRALMRVIISLLSLSSLRRWALIRSIRTQYR